MYIQITTTCNMNCRHCCFRCTKNGDHMSMETYAKAVDFHETHKEYNNNDHLTIGGGEPTIHPLFLDFVHYSAAKKVDQVIIITNGKYTKMINALIKMIETDINYKNIKVLLSIDPFHESIAFKTRLFFERKQTEEHPNFGVYNPANFNSVLAAGRANDNDLGTEIGCCCTTMLINPLGDLYACGCQLEQYGSILTGYVIPDYHIDHGYKCLGNTECPKEEAK